MILLQTIYLNKRDTSKGKNIILTARSKLNSFARFSFEYIMWNRHIYHSNLYR
jgi:hypothetical protein